MAAPPPSTPALSTVHHRRLREVYRSAGWPCQDPLEVELLAAGLIERVRGPLGHETLRVTDAGIALLAHTLQRNRARRELHEELVERVAREMTRAGRLAWRGLSLRAKLPDSVGADGSTVPGAWVVAMPDVFSIRHTTVEAYVEPIVHEIKVRRGDLLGELRNPAKRAAYLQLGGELWYVLREGIGEPDEIPPECGVLIARESTSGHALDVARPAPKRAMRLPYGLPFATWMALARATPLDGWRSDDAQLLLGDPTRDPTPPHPDATTDLPDPVRRARHALWAALVLILIWGANFSVQKQVFNALSPGGFLFVRYLIMPVAASVLLLRMYGTRWPKVPRADLLALLKLGIAGHVLHVGLVTYGIHWSTPFSSSLILACGPMFTLLILRWYGIERLSRGQVAGVALACAGVLTFLSDKLLGGHWQASGGDLTLLVAAAFFSYYTVAAKPLIERHGGVLVMTYATLLGSGPVVLLSLPAGLRVDWLHVSPAIWVGLVYAVLISAFLGWLVWGWVNAVRGVARSAPLMYLMPPVAGLVAWALTGERYTGIKLAGAALTLAGVAVAQFASNRRRSEVLESMAPVD